MDRIGYLIAIILAVFGLAAGAILLEFLQQYPAGSWQKEAILAALILIIARYVLEI